MRPIFLSFALLIFQQPTVTVPEADIRAINDQLNLYAQRMHDKQEDAVLASYTKDATFVDPAGHHCTTPAQLRQLYDTIFATYDSDLHFNSPEIHLRGTAFHVSGTYTETLRDRKSGHTMHSHGTYNFTLRSFYDGRWSFSRMQWTGAIE